MTKPNKRTTLIQAIASKDLNYLNAHLEDKNKSITLEQFAEAYRQLLEKQATQSIPGLKTPLREEDFEDTMRAIEIFSKNRKAGISLEECYGGAPQHIRNNVEECLCLILDI